MIGNAEALVMYIIAAVTIIVVVAAKRVTAIRREAKAAAGDRAGAPVPTMSTAAITNLGGPVMRMVTVVRSLAVSAGRCEGSSP